MLPCIIQVNVNVTGVELKSIIECSSPDRDIIPNSSNEEPRGKKICKGWIKKRKKWGEWRETKMTVEIKV